jgi:DNA-binding response OmpR family regulator
MSLPLVYNELMTEVERLNKVTKINYKRYKLGKYFYNAKTSQLFEEKSSSVINLTELESKFLNYMLKKNGGATKTQILSEVWKHNKELDTHTLESLIYRLRKKIENNPNEPSVLINDSKRYFIKI